MKTINIAKEFTTVPGPRYIREGPHSGELFRETMLLPRFTEAQSAGEQLVIELDGVRFGYPTSFLEESFGGLARVVGIEAARNGLIFRSSEEPLLGKEILSYIDDADKTSVERLAKKNRLARA